MKIARWGQVAFAAALVFACTMALLPRPPDLAHGVNDKYLHMLAFTVLALLARLGWPQASALRLAERLSFVGALIELFQSIPALRRDCDPIDWVADTAAVLVTLGLLSLIRQRHAAARSD